MPNSIAANHINSCSGVPKPQGSQRFRSGVGEAGRSCRKRMGGRETLMAKDCSVVIGLCIYNLTLDVLGSPGPLGCGKQYHPNFCFCPETDFA